MHTQNIGLDSMNDKRKGSRGFMEMDSFLLPFHPENSFKNCCSESRRFLRTECHRRIWNWEKIPRFFHSQNFHFYKRIHWWKKELGVISVSSAFSSLQRLASHDILSVMLFFLQCEPWREFTRGCWCMRKIVETNFWYCPHSLYDPPSLFLWST